MRDGLPVGAVCAFAGRVAPVRRDANRIWDQTVCPDGSPEVPPDGEGDQPALLVETCGWMLCDGRFLLVARYPELFRVLGFHYGRGPEGQFRIPDYRGLFLRGVDHGAGRDPDAQGRTGANGSGKSAEVGSLQCDALQDHFHKYSAVATSQLADKGSAGAALTQDVDTQGVSKPARSSNETRPRNVAVNYLIRFR